MICLGYPITGKTWFCFLSSYVFNVIFVDLDVMPGSKPKEVYFRELTNVSKRHLALRDKARYNIFKSHKSKNIKSTAEETVVLLTKDARDIYKPKLHIDFFYLEEKLRLKRFNLRTITKRV